MFKAVNIPCQHKDLVHDVAYDHHGHRLATASSDQTVKIWDFDSTSDTWICTASWKSHFGSVWKVTWAHPEFGQVIATCSFDRTASIWEEIPGSDQSHTGKWNQICPYFEHHILNLANFSGQNDDSKSHWVKKASLVDSRTSVTDIKFGPRNLGLLLATCSADGIVRIYEAPDVMNLSQWSLQHEIQCNIPCSCVTWSMSMFKSHAPTIAVGSDDSNSTGIYLKS